MRIDRTAEVISIPTIKPWDNSGLRDRLEERQDAESVLAELHELARQRMAIAEVTGRSHRGRKH
jgi:hypothetical protein